MMMNTRAVLIATIAGFLFFLFWFSTGRDMNEYLYLNLSTLPLILTAWFTSWLERNRWWLWIWLRVVFWKEEKERSEK
jgi:hypothetical protein